MGSIVGNRYYNDPAVGAAFSNIAQMFAPPSGSDAAGYSVAALNKQKLSVLQAMMADPNNPNFDREGMVTGLWNPAQGFELTKRNQDLMSSDSRYKVNMDDATSLQKTQMEQAGALQQLYAKPVVLGQGQTAFVPPATAKATGLAPTLTGMFDVQPGEQMHLPGGQVVAGAPVMPSETQAIGSALQEALRTGVIGPKDVAAKALTQPVEKVVGPNGEAVFAKQSDAAGQQAFVDRSASSLDTKNWISPDKKVGGVAYLDTATKQYYDTVSKQPIPQGSSIFTGQVSGGAGETGFTKVTSDERKAGYVYQMTKVPIQNMLDAYDHKNNHALPTTADYQLMVGQNMAPAALSPLIASKMSPEGQLFLQNFRSAVPYQLLIQSGAAITEPEYQRKMLELMPTTGDTPQVLAAKRRNFETFSKAVKDMAGGAVNEQTGGDPTPTAQAATATAQTAAAPTANPAAIDQHRFDMPPITRAEYEALPVGAKYTDPEGNVRTKR